jgi:hypothetical protein
MPPYIALFLYLATTPLQFLPAILAITSKRPGRYAILGCNIAYWVLTLLLSAGGVLAAAIALVAWLGLLSWSIHPPMAPAERAPEDAGTSS